MPIEVLAVDGQEVSGQSLRLAGFHATRGGNGVALPQDLRVKSLGVPGSGVQVVRGPSGSAALVSRFPSAAAQSYLTVATETETVPVPATDSSGGATRYIIEHVNDPQYPGQSAGPPAVFACVDSLTPFAQIPHIVLARINQPAATATITQDMITDLRRVANPLKEPFYISEPQIASDNDGFLTRTDPDGEWFPNGNGSQLVHFPEWATYMHVAAEWLAMRFEVGSNGNGELWVEFGPYARPSVRQYAIQRFRFDAGSAQNVTRQYPKASQGNVRIPEAIRGTDQLLVMKGRLTGGSGVQLDGVSGIEMSGWFLQLAE